MDLPEHPNLFCQKFRATEALAYHGRERRLPSGAPATIASASAFRTAIWADGIKCGRTEHTMTDWRSRNPRLIPAVGQAIPWSQHLTGFASGLDPFPLLLRENAGTCASLSTLANVFGSKLPSALPEARSTAFGCRTPSWLRFMENNSVALQLPGRSLGPEGAGRRSIGASRIVSQRSGAAATVVAPLWPDRSWHQLLTEMASEIRVYPPSPELYQHRAVRVHAGLGPARWSVVVFRLPCRRGCISATPRSGSSNQA